MKQYAPALLECQVDGLDFFGRALARDVELLPDLFERVLALAPDGKAKARHLLFLCESVQSVPGFPRFAGSLSQTPLRPHPGSRRLGHFDGSASFWLGFVNAMPLGRIDPSKCQQRACWDKGEERKHCYALRTVI